MPRKKREWYPGATYHIMSRGNRRGTIFKEKTDHLDFLNAIGDVKERYNFKIHSICLMTNHFHMSGMRQMKKYGKLCTDCCCRLRRIITESIISPVISLRIVIHPV